MSKAQLFLLLFALLLVVGMYRLPTIVLKEKNRHLESGQNQTDRQSASTQNHTFSLSPAQQESLNKLKKNLSLSDNLEKKITFADSIAKLFQKFGVFDSAAFYFNRVSEWKPETETWKQAGNASYKAFEFYAVVDAAKSAEFREKAQSFYQKILERQPEDLDIQARLAMTQVNSQSPMQGILKLREIAEKDPKNEFVLLNLGLLSMQTRQYDKAQGRFEQLLTVNPDDSQAKILLAQCFLAQEKADKAMTLLENVIQNEKDSVLKSSAEELLKTLKKY